MTGHRMRSDPAFVGLVYRQQAIATGLGGVNPHGVLVSNVEQGARRFALTRTTARPGSSNTHPSPLLLPAAACGVESIGCPLPRGEIREVLLVPDTTEDAE